MVIRFLLTFILTILFIPQSVRSQEKSTSNQQEKLLQTNGLKTDSTSLIEFLRKRSLTPTERTKVDALIKQLGHRLYRKRELASKALIARGMVVVRLLERELENDDVEVARRAKDCIDAIRQGPSIDLVLAVLHLIEQRKLTEAVDALVLFIPYSEDHLVEQTVLATLLNLAKSNKTVIDTLQKSAKDTEATRRAAVGYVLSRIPSKDYKEIVKRLLQDSSTLVRYHTARGLLMRGEKSGVMPMIELLETAPTELAWNVEALLFRLAGTNTPTIVAGENTPAGRRQWRNAWAKWWQLNQNKVDLAQLHKANPYRGWTLVPLMHSNEIYEIDRKQNVRWRMKELPQPRDAQVLPRNRILISEARTHRVTERDRRTGKILWEFPAKDTSFCKRLPNGNTVIGMGQKVIVVTPAKEIVFTYKPEQSFYIHGMDHLPNGQFILVSMGGLLRQVDRSGKVVFTKRIGAKANNWCAVSGMPNGHYLVTSISPGEIIEVDRNGKVYWRHKLKDASCAKPMPNGNILIASFSQRMLREVTRSKKTVWEHRTATTPWRIRLR